MRTAADQLRDEIAELVSAGPELSAERDRKDNASKRAADAAREANYAVHTNGEEILKRCKALRVLDPRFLSFPDLRDICAREFGREEASHPVAVEEGR